MESKKGLKIKNKAMAGSYESNDLLVLVEPSEELKIEIKSVVYELFYENIRETVEKTLKEMDIRDGRWMIDDRGALPYVIRARIKTCAKRSSNEL